jgi:branched-chain amino acid transport system substrate-binding protein
VTVAADYAFGWEQVGGFQRTFEEAGGQVIQKLWPPLGTTDFGPYLPQIKRDADAVFAVMVAAMALRFPKQYQDAGLKARLPLIGGGTSFDEFVLPSLGDEAVGAITPLIYSAAIDTPVNRRFVKEFRTKYGKVPGYYGEASYTAARWIAESRRRKRRGQGKISRGAQEGGGFRCAARTHQARCSRQSDPEHLRPESGEERR